MANVGRFFCVALPFGLTIMAIIFLLVDTFSGITNKSDLYMFRVNVTDLSISIDNLASMITSRDLSDILGSIESDFSSGVHSVTSLIEGILNSTSLSTNITASDLGLADVYDVYLWGYCETWANGTRHCISPEFNWAKSHINTTELEAFSSVTSDLISLPSDIIHSLKLFVTVDKWTQVVFIIALIALAADLLFGIFATCSRVLSCITWVIATIASIAVFGAAIMSTVLSSTVVGGVISTAKTYGAHAHVGTKFIAIAWIAVAFCMAAGLFWIFTVCCCASSSSSSPRRSKRFGKARGLGDAEKNGAMASASPAQYHPIGGQNPNYASVPAPTHAPAHHNSGAPRSDLAYEPYAHRA